MTNKTKAKLYLLASIATGILFLYLSHNRDDGLIINSFYKSIVFISSFIGGGNIAYLTK